jgi:acyl-coenzyme A thioesterase PaaI-like protein
VSGPALFTLADLAAYAALLAHIGPEPLIVTTSLR